MVGFGRTAKSVHQTKALREIFRMGMVSGVLVLMGFAKVGFFMIFDPFFWTVFFPTVSNVMKMRNEHVRISVFWAENDTK